MPLTDARRPSPSEPVSALRRVPITENGEPMVDFLAHCPGLLLDRPRFRYARTTFLRESVAAMLCRADSVLYPQGMRLAIVEGWRPLHIQSRMYRASWNWWKERHPDWSDATLKRTVNRFTAPVGDARVPPPHTTGGAVDLMLADTKGVLRDHCSPYAPFDPRSYALGAPGLSDDARRTRDLLTTALTLAGLTCYPSEYWHWSYGDQGWAYRGGHPFALYGTAAPPGYLPDPADLSDTPLEAIPTED